MHKIGLLLILLMVGATGCPRPKDQWGTTSTILRKRVQLKPLSREEIIQTIHSRAGPIQECYEDVLKKHPKLSGKILVSWAISGDGGIKDVHTKARAFDNDKLERCVLSVVRTLKFRAHPGAKMTIIYPFIFRGRHSKKPFLAKQAIDKVVRANAARFRGCFERYPVVGRKNIRITLQWTIGLDGRVSRITFYRLSHRLGVPLRACIKARIRHMVFPRPKGGVVTVSYPFGYSRE